jgi:hypothetical protein
VQMLASVWSFWTYYLYTGDAGAVTGAYRRLPAVRAYLTLRSLDSNGPVAHRAGDWDWDWDWGSNVDAPSRTTATRRRPLPSGPGMSNGPGSRERPGAGVLHLVHLASGVAAAQAVSGAASWGEGTRGRTEREGFGPSGRRLRQQGAVGGQCPAWLVTSSL